MRTGKPWRNYGVGDMDTGTHADRNGYLDKRRNDVVLNQDG